MSSWSANTGRRGAGGGEGTITGTKRAINEQGMTEVEAKLLIN
jgi:hypothetical protein